MLSHVLPLDAVSLHPINIRHVHHKIHDGKTFSMCDSVSVANTSSKDYLLITPATNSLHMVYQVIADNAGTMFIYESPTTSNNGTVMNLWNRNRQSAITTSASIFVNPTVSTAGSTLCMENVSTGNKTGTTVEHNDEWILKKSTKYIFRFTAGANLNYSIRVIWYEE